MCRHPRRHPSTLDPYGQARFGVRFDWGSQGATAIATGRRRHRGHDVLSFTTTLSVAVDAGIQVFPYRVRDASAAAFAASRGAVLAVGRSEAGPTGVSLSPVSVRRATEPGRTAHGTTKFVLPSPNGAAICRQLAEAKALVVGAWLRNATACAEWVVKAVRGPVAVVAAGERWPGDMLRPAVEDLWGAGARHRCAGRPRRRPGIARGGVRAGGLPGVGPHPGDGAGRLRVRPGARRSRLRRGDRASRRRSTCPDGRAGALRWSRSRSA